MSPPPVIWLVSGDYPQICPYHVAAHQWITKAYHGKSNPCPIGERYAKYVLIYSPWNQFITKIASTLKATIKEMNTAGRLCYSCCIFDIYDPNIQQRGAAVDTARAPGLPVMCFTPFRMGGYSHNTHARASQARHASSGIAGQGGAASRNQWKQRAGSVVYKYP